jgi:catechol 2,3-dioxygenase-like lactoylglutathione lyase family enzyme
MARARIGKLFHLTPLVDSLADAEYFFNATFSPLCMMRNYSPHWHRHAAIYVIAETSIEPMEVLPPLAGQDATSWYRYTERFGMRVHNMAFYVENIDDLERRLNEAGVRTTDAGSGNTLFCHPKDTPGMLEFFPYSFETWQAGDPRMRPEWARFRDAFWGRHHHLGLQRMSHITVVVNDLTGAEKFYVELLDGVPLPEQPATVPEASSRYVAVGEDTIVELLSPGDGASRAARDLAQVGESVIGVTFTVRSIPTAIEFLERTAAHVATSSEHDIVLDVERTWGCEYRFTDRVLAGDPRV